MWCLLDGTGFYLPLLQQEYVYWFIIGGIVSISKIIFGPYKRWDWKVFEAIHISFWGNKAVSGRNSMLHYDSGLENKAFINTGFGVC
jgi:hypothetical protein